VLIQTQAIGHVLAACTYACFACSGGHLIGRHRTDYGIKPLPGVPVRAGQKPHVAAFFARVSASPARPGLADVRAPR
jgi:hypothetical protein